MYRIKTVYAEARQTLGVHDALKRTAELTGKPLAEVCRRLGFEHFAKLAEKEQPK
jgi:hypothetical protein